MNAYRDGMVLVAYCSKCSAETDQDLECECPGQYVRKIANQTVDKLIDNQKAKT
jgi:hypothetical protein